MIEVIIWENSCLREKNKNQFKQQTESYPSLWLGETIHTRGHAWVDDDKYCVFGCHYKIHSLPLRRVVENVTKKFVIEYDEM